MSWSTTGGSHFLASNPPLPGPTRILGLPTGGDDTTLFTAAIAALPTGGKIILSGLYSLTAGNIALASVNDLTFEGSSDAATGIVNNGVNPMFVVTGSCARNKFRHLLLKNGIGAGHIFSAGSSTCSYWVFDGVQTDTTNTATKSVWDHRGAGMVCIGMEWKGDYTINGHAAASVPAFNIVSDNGAANANLWGKGLINPMGFYPIWIESTNAGTFIYDNKCRDVLFETPNAGCVKAIGSMNTIFDTCMVYDLATSTADLFSLAQGSGAATRHPTFRNLVRRAGTLGGGLADIALGVGANAYIEQCATALAVGLTVNGTGATQPTAINNGINGLTWIARPGSAFEIFGGNIVTGAVQTAIGTGALQALAQLYPGVPGGGFQTGIGFLASAGAPSNAQGNNGDLYCRSDGGSLTTIYQKRIGAWVGIV